MFDATLAAQRFLCWRVSCALMRGVSGALARHAARFQLMSRRC